ncbi:MAG TPA: hypothetical protein VJ781_10875 [Pyrinomonadaceae bacterium]|jgi:hypothetical protein|nr:hypothetical protein [Pyrinomonadaceae bacterium]
MSVKTIVAAVAGGVVFFLLGFLIFGIALNQYMQSMTVPYPGLFKVQPNFVAIALFTLTWGGLLAMIFDYWADIRTFAGGAIAGAIVMFLIAFAHEMQTKAFMVLSIGYIPVIVNVLVTAFMGAIAGGVVGAVLGAMTKEPAAAE